MTRSVTWLAAAAIALSPSFALAQVAPGQGQYNGTGYWHFNGPAEAPGPDVECGEEDALGSPGQASEAPGSAFNEEGTGHARYAGEQPQNTRNSASFSRYDVAAQKYPNRVATSVG